MCRISRNLHFQTWNGYVGLPDEHPCSGKGYDDIDVNVHGGLTYEILFPNHYDIILLIGLLVARIRYWSRMG